MPTDRVQTIDFSNGNSAHLIRPRAGAPAHKILSALALPALRALILLNGGTAPLEPSLQEMLAPALENLEFR